MAVDGGGSVYVTGFSTGDTTVYDYATVKYTSLGEQRWVARYDGPGHLLDEAQAIAVTPSGDEILITGYSYGGSSRKNDCTTIMYDSSGHQLWLDAYNGGGSDEGDAIAFGSDRSFCIAGRAGGDLLVIKYVQNGGVAEDRTTPWATRSTLVAEPSVVKGALLLSGASGHKPQATSWLLDVSGRMVLVLHPGANDVRALAPGVYFVLDEPQAASFKPQAGPQSRQTEVA